MKIALYMRVSTDRQHQANQRPALEAWAAQRGYEIVAVYQEQESAWKNGHQRELSQLIYNAQQRRFDAILVWDLDRLTRGGPLAILNLQHQLSTWGCRVFSVQQSWTETPSDLDPLLFSIYGWVASFESKHRSERTRAGIDRARAEGIRLGRPPGKKDKKPRHRRRQSEMPVR